MQYSREDIEKLWAVIRKYRHKFKETNLGLKQVNFNVPLEEFKETYEELTKINNTESAKVSENIEQVIEIITRKENEIKYHHLSCAAETSYKDNTALCIHYTNKNTNKNHAITIPGINYIPTKETLEKLKKLEMTL